MNKLPAFLLTLTVLLSMTACTRLTDNTQTSSIAVCLASEPDSIDPALNSTSDGATMVSHLFSGLAKWTEDGDGNPVVTADAAEELTEGVTNDDGTVTYTYTIKDGVSWSDGKAVTADDFVFAWQRAASVELSADYGYMFEVVDGYEDSRKTDDNGIPIHPDAELNVKALDERTLEVTLANPVPYWNELLAFPVYFPVRRDVVANENWASEPATYVCNGPYRIASWEHNSVIVLEKNESYHNADTVRMERIEFYLSDDQNNMLANFENGAWLLIDSVPNNEIPSLKEKYPEEFVITGQIGTCYVNWNVNENILPEDSTLTGAEAEAAMAEIRNALSLLYDRSYIAEEIGQAGQLPASTFVAMGITDADGTEFYKNAGTSREYDGYYNVSKDAVGSNYDNAIKILKKYYEWDGERFTNFPTITYLYNTDDTHKAIGEYLQSALGALGINMQLENREWNTFLNTRKEGDYTIARNGWIADYNDPICFLDMWTTDSGNNDAQLGKGAHKELALYDLDLTEYGYDINVKNGTWAQTYDILISKIKTCTDNEVRYELMHTAEDMLMATGTITPLYYYTDVYMIDDSVSGFFVNPFGYKFFTYCEISEK